jgi:hypothetical protein
MCGQAAAPSLNVIGEFNRGNLVRREPVTPFDGVLARTNTCTTSQTEIGRPKPGSRFNPELRSNMLK